LHLLLLIHRTPKATLFPYTTLFRSENIKKEAEAYNKLNIPGRYLSELPLDIDVEAAIQMDHQAEIQPVSFLHGVLEAVKQTNGQDRKSTRLNSSHVSISYAVFCLKQ